MAEVKYYVALPFVASDDGVAASEPTECLNPNAVVILRMLSARACANGATPSRSSSGSLIGWSAFKGPDMLRQTFNSKVGPDN